MLLQLSEVSTSTVYFYYLSTAVILLNAENGKGKWEVARKKVGSREEENGKWEEENERWEGEKTMIGRGGKRVESRECGRGGE